MTNFLVEFDEFTEEAVFKAGSEFFPVGLFVVNEGSEELTVSRTITDLKELAKCLSWKVDEETLHSVAGLVVGAGKRMKTNESKMTIGRSPDGRMFIRSRDLAPKCEC